MERALKALRLCSTHTQAGLSAGICLNGNPNGSLLILSLAVATIVVLIAAYYAKPAKRQKYGDLIVSTSTLLATCLAFYGAFS